MKIKDERLELSKLQVNKELMYIITTVLLLSFFQKVFVLKQNIYNGIGEIVCLIIIAGYTFFRNLWLGNFPTVSEKVDKKVIILSTFISAVAATFIFAVNNFYMYGSKYSGIFDYLFWASISIMFIQVLVISGIGFYFLGRREIKKNLENFQDSDYDE